MLSGHLAFLVDLPPNIFIRLTFTDTGLVKLLVFSKVFFSSLEVLSGMSQQTKNILR